MLHCPSKNTTPLEKRKKIVFNIIHTRLFSDNPQLIQKCLPTSAMEQTTMQTVVK